MEIYVSSLAFKGASVSDLADQAHHNNYSIEFSSGLPYDSNAEKIYTSCKVKRLLHNYFPAPKDPFVINLASSNEKIRRRSIDHCISGLNLSASSGSSFFAAHAGFCIDPEPTMLGNSITITNEFKRSLHWQLFIDSISEVLKSAKKIGVHFFIENNVLTKKNYLNKVNPLLCCESGEILKLVDEVSSDEFGILLDTAHLKVSSKTLDLNLHSEYKTLKNCVRAFHHSDNDGETDSNDLLTESYWFLPYVKDVKAFTHIVEVKNISINQINNQIELLKRNAN
ncbi:MAG: TIM barrel protein [Cyclobacteriaceae bacterium]